MNLYAYTGNDPVNFVDPYGLATCAGEECEEIIVTAPRIEAVNNASTFGFQFGVSLRATVNQNILNGTHFHNADEVPFVDPRRSLDDGAVAPADDELLAILGFGSGARIVGQLGRSLVVKAKDGTLYVLGPRGPVYAKGSALGRFLNQGRRFRLGPSKGDGRLVFRLTGDWAKNIPLSMRQRLGFKETPNGPKLDLFDLGPIK